MTTSPPSSNQGHSKKSFLPLSATGGPRNQFLAWTVVIGGGVGLYVFVKARTAEKKRRDNAMKLAALQQQQQQQSDRAVQEAAAPPLTAIQRKRRAALGLVSEGE